MYAAANSYFNLGNYTQAAEYYRQLHAKYPDTVDPLYHMGMCCVNQGDDDGALEHFTHALATVADGSDEQAQVYCQMSLIFSRKGQHEQAVAYVDEALSIYPNNAELLIMKGHELMAQGSYNECTEVFLEALNLDAPVERSLFLIGVSMLENSYVPIAYYILKQLKGNPAIEDHVIYPYLCFCEWNLQSSTLKDTLTEALAICPQKTYDIFMLEPAQGETAEAMIERLKQLKNEN